MKARFEARDHNLGVIDDLFERDGDRAFVSLDNHPHTIANQNCLDAGLVDEFGDRTIVGRQHCDLVAVALHGREIFNRQASLTGHQRIVTRCAKRDNGDGVAAASDHRGESA